MRLHLHCPVCDHTDTSPVTFPVTIANTTTTAVHWQCPLCETSHVRDVKAGVLRILDRLERPLSMAKAK